MKELFASGLIFISSLFGLTPTAKSIPEPVVIQEKAPTPPSQKITKEENNESTKELAASLKEPKSQSLKLEKISIQDRRFSLYYVQDSFGEEFSLSSSEKENYPGINIKKYHTSGPYEGGHSILYIFPDQKISTPKGTLYRATNDRQSYLMIFEQDDGRIYKAIEVFTDENYYYDRKYHYNILKGMSIDKNPESHHAGGANLAIADPNSLAPLQKIATTDFFYEFENPNATHLKWLYEEFREKSKYSYEEWLAEKPVIYFKSIWGELIRGLKGGDFLQYYNWEVGLGGGGKPVIYLYPPTTQDISVSVYPNGGFTITDPDPVQNTWEVSSTPESEITYQNKTYPYLFWEGVLVGYPEIDFTQGFVSDKQNIEATLTHALTQAGLNTKEIADFNEFWISRLKRLMTTNFVTFHLDSEMLDQTAPLNISPTPNNILRVFLDYQFSDEKPLARPQTFPKFSRNGFSVVEWGGRLDEILTATSPHTSTPTRTNAIAQ